MNKNKLDVFHSTDTKINWLEKRLEQIEETQEMQREIIQGQKQVLETIQRVSELHHTDLDRDDVLDIVCKEIVDLGCFRSLMMALVNPQTQTISVVRNFVYSNLNRHTLKTPASVLVKRPLPHQVFYSLDDENITAYTVRTKECQIIVDREDARLDSKIEEVNEWNDKIAYFIPIRQVGNDVVGVVATGSLRAEQDDVCKRIELIQPALNVIGTLIQGIWHQPIEDILPKSVLAPESEGLSFKSGTRNSESHCIGTRQQRNCGSTCS